MNDTPPSEIAPAAATVAQPPLAPVTPAPAGERMLTATALVIAVLALLLLAWQWYDSRSRVEALRQEVAK